MAVILIIEDDAASQAIQVGLLHAAGHRCVGVKSIQKDLLLSLYNIVDLILCDILLPELSGFEIARAVRHAVGTRHVPLVAVTAQAMHGDRERILAAGFDGYLSKPIAPRSFAHQVETYLTNHTIPRSASSALSTSLHC